MAIYATTWVLLANTMLPEQAHAKIDLMWKIKKWSSKKAADQLLIFYMLILTGKISEITG